MKLLIIDEEFPYPLNTGKRIRSFHIAAILGKLHDVAYLAYGQEDSAGYRFMKSSGLRPYAVDPPDRNKSGAKFYFKLLANLFSPYPYIVTSHYSDRFMQQLVALVAAEKIDCIICEWTPYAIYIKDLRSVGKIIVAHNVESTIWEGYFANERNPLKKAYIAIQAGKVRRFEAECFSWTDGATAVSTGDAETISKYNAGIRVEVIENGVDLNYFQPQEGLVDAETLVFTGSMDWRPNQDAAIYFANEIFPRLRGNIPGIKAYFVGRDPSKKVKDLSKIDGIVITGTVEDVRPYIARAAVYIVPLRIGGGSRLKILEAMAMKKAVISTSLGADGLRLKNGESIMICDGPENFSRGIFELLENFQLRDRIAASGLAVVEKYYRWEGLGRKFSDYICSIVQE